jgi:hypothetical protein
MPDGPTIERTLEVSVGLRVGPARTEPDVDDLATDRLLTGRATWTRRGTAGAGRCADDNGEFPIEQVPSPDVAGLFVVVGFVPGSGTRVTPPRKVF